ncbi:MAG: hypothetical protein HY553_17350 [Elusimicrobia bacterium]|nr:hypothetical protein [Elusimicrobiota bacterium]
MPRLILHLLPLLWAAAQPAGEQLGALATRLQFRAAYDGDRSRTPSAVEGRFRSPSSRVPPLSDARALREAKALLDDASTRSTPFVFHPQGRPQWSAPASGLEGFLYEEREIASRYGRDALSHHVDDYGRYLDHVLAGVTWTEEGRRRLRELQAGPGSALERYGRLMDFVASYTEELRAAVAAADRAAWARTARIYELFPRAYNLAGRRAAEGGARKLEAKRFFADFEDRDFAPIRDMGFDTLWVMGIFPIGKRGAGGTAGGSPYSIQDYESIHPELGTPAEFKGFVRRAHKAGLRVVVDFVVNHTSLDSKLLLEDPNYFIHRPADAGGPPRGSFEHVDPGTGQRLWVSHGGYDSYGTLSFWEDTAQLNYANVRLRRRMIQVVDRWAGEFGVDGFRVDMAYQVLNGYFSRNWRRPMPKREFLEELITEIKGRYPGVAFIAEGYDGWDELSRAGFDLTYSKNDMGRAGGHAGWYDALVSRDPAWIRRAIRREAFLDWQRAGADGLPFVGNHDEPAPRRALGPWTEGATFLTLLKPGGLLFYGSAEIGFDRPEPHEHKPIPFSVPVTIDWSRPDAELKRFHQETFRLSREVHAALGPARIEALPKEGEAAWVGYLLVPERAGRLQGAAVLANPTDRPVPAEFHAFGAVRRELLPPFGYRFVRF